MMTVGPWFLRTKRAIDIAICVLISPLVLIVLAACAIAIRLDSPGAVLFTQQRTGRNGVRFAMYKFRTMVHNAEELKPSLQHLNILPPPDFKIPNDPRITGVGKFLRKTSLDELPQLVNVLFGDMSLVGPRPCLEWEARMFPAEFQPRFSVRPGITGLWQVSGRSDLSWEDSVRLDLYYVENWSFAGDIQILWKTVSAVVRAHGAY
jgi:lipopolysaccharide/colanic/teichoic acid biosynthesis glycosyltransferase